MAASAIYRGGVMTPDCTTDSVKQDVAPACSVGEMRCVMSIFEEIGAGVVVRAMWPQDDPNRGSRLVSHYPVVLQAWEEEGCVRLVYGTSKRVPSSASVLFDTEFMVNKQQAQQLGLTEPTRWDACTILDLPIGNVKEVCGVLPREVVPRFKGALEAARYNWRNQPPPWHYRPPKR